MYEVQSPRRDDIGIEAMLAARSPAPRVTLDDVMANIASEHYFTGLDGASAAGAINSRMYGTSGQALSLLTFCVLVLRNGFTVIGHSACVSPENFDAQIGRDIARRNAIEQIWPLLGYLLKERTYESNISIEPRDYAPAAGPGMSSPTRNSEG